MIWLWINSPGKLHLKIKSSGRHWKKIIIRSEQLAGENCISNHHFEHGWPCHCHTIKMNSSDCFVSWFHMEMRCRCTTSPSHKAEFGPSAQFTDLVISTCVTPSFCTPHWPLEGLGSRLGRAGKFSSNISNPQDWGYISFSAGKTTSFFSCYLLASKVWWKIFVGR